MYIHLGGNRIVRTKDIIAILNIESTLNSSLLNTKELSQEELRSVVITKNETLGSTISSLTLLKRLEQDSWYEWTIKDGE
ncbi:extracellular matrix regulator RemB [Risungbinella massiliensis]|uniref:extracellular matrix regulator RemB n=1 Tax=Risungbinella massiliensis TaxID=1329796 RepID=UPI0005CC2F24|nr:DUF370 domain-containing protein [Risungbinella massiliensis]